MPLRILHIAFAAASRTRQLRSGDENEHGEGGGAHYGELTAGVGSSARVPSHVILSRLRGSRPTGVGPETKQAQAQKGISPANSSTFRPIPPPPRDYTETQVKVDSSRRFSSPIDVAEREYRERFRPQQQQPQASTGLELVPVRRPRHEKANSNNTNDFTVDERTVIARPKFREEIKITEEIRESSPAHSEQSAKMGYFDDEGKHD